MAEPGPWLTPEQLRVWRTWLGLHSTLPNALNRQLATSSGLSLPDYEVMVCLSEADEGVLRSGDLAEILGWERSRLSHHIRRMQERGLLDRAACPRDGRVTYLTLTPLGLDMLRSAAPGHARIVRELLFDDMPADELAAAGRFLARAEQRLAARENSEDTPGPAGPQGTPCR